MDIRLQQSQRREYLKLGLFEVLILPSKVLQVERHIGGALQIHPYPRDYKDTSKQCHCAFFMGVKRKQEARECQEFDLRVHYFYWRPGMEVYISQGWI